MAKTQLRVTDHALIRYLERVRGFKFDKEIAEIRKICGEEKNASIKAHGCVFEIKDGALISIMPDSGTPNHTKHVEVRSKNW